MISYQQFLFSDAACDSTKWAKQTCFMLWSESVCDHSEAQVPHRHSSAGFQDTSLEGVDSGPITSERDCAPKRFQKKLQGCPPPKVYEVTSFYPLAGENLPCNTDLRWEEPATPEHSSSFLSLFGVLDAVLIRAQARSCNTRSASGPKMVPGLVHCAKRPPVRWGKPWNKMNKTGNFFTSSDPHPDTLFWHSFWHTIWKYIWHIYIYIIQTLTFYLTFFLAFYLASILTYFLAYIPTFFQAFYLTFYLASFQAFILAFYLQSILTFFLAFYLTLFDIYSDILFGILSGILAFSLAWVRAKAPSTASWASYIEIPQSPRAGRRQRGGGDEDKSQLSWTNGKRATRKHIR